ncbi:hypothetical protein HEQ60_09080 [Haematospirillum sp. H1815]|uniref:hypothetical protein n=1 Tax=Haematospirillum sp. H1815 TaxID=2723108 RepID=UPI00143BBF10|nr:hypothetical protein [Haematospirillum sp. H1815]NKD77909.1 hypothetical protein [Haematospirillum sp. H1815]
MAQIIAEWPEDSPAILVSPAHNGKQYLVSNIVVSANLLSRAQVFATTPVLAETSEEQDEDNNDIVSTFNLDWV